MNWTKLAFILLILALIVLGLVFYRPIFTHLLFAVIFSYILDPLITRLEYHRVPRWLSVLLLYGVIAGLLAWFTIRLVPELVRQGNTLLALLQSSDKPVSQQILNLPFIRSINTFLLNVDSQIPSLNLSQKFVALIDTTKMQLGELPKLLIHNYQAVLSTVSFVATIPLISFFILKDKQALRKGILSLAPNRYFELILILLNKVDETVGRFLRAMLLEVISVSIMASIALSIVRVPYAILIGITAGVANIIPYFGPWLAATIAILTILVNGYPPIMILYVGLAMYLVQVVDNNFVYPVVVGKTIKMHPLIVLLTVIAGGWFGGIIWMLVSVPLVFMIYSLVKELYVNLRQFRLL